MLDQLSKNDQLWQSIAFNISKDKDISRELVQQMYLKVYEINLHKDKQNKRYITAILWNLFKDICNKKSKNVVISLEDVIHVIDKEDNYNTIGLDDFELSILKKSMEIDIEDIKRLELNYDYSVRAIAEIEDEHYMSTFRKLIRARKEILGDDFKSKYKNKRLKHKR